ncbi:MAG: hypothetical protein OZSIB_3130 [Candidatus Ozemobacter sibiricus]|uniref:Uncharacterized protein n=1 Tax=Candidatus Ozemobacter sibiricus TaxID=2268124 RepID=A0A367ZQF9_9BACT|nr:MAG: hypothetical protein OZSIB_3130 [Candidatus Ozemobacter sibiricus]
MGGFWRVFRRHKCGSWFLRSFDRQRFLSGHRSVPGVFGKRRAPP